MDINDKAMPYQVKALPYDHAYCDSKAMLTGRELGAAIREAIRLKGVTQREVARVFDVRPPSVQDWMNKGTIGKDKLPAIWHYFSDVVGPEHWGLANFPRWPVTRKEKPIVLVDEPQPEFAGFARPSRTVPVLGTARMGSDGFYELTEGEGNLEAISDDPAAFALRVKGQSMYPAIRDGWYVLVEPSSQPSQGEYVLIQLKDGRKMVKELMYRRSDSIEVVSINDGSRSTFDLFDLDRERGLQAIGAVIPPSKWRPS